MVGVKGHITRGWAPPAATYVRSRWMAAGGSRPVARRHPVRRFGNFGQGPGYRDGIGRYQCRTRTNTKIWHGRQDDETGIHLGEGRTPASRILGGIQVNRLLSVLLVATLRHRAHRPATSAPKDRSDLQRQAARAASDQPGSPQSRRRRRASAASPLRLPSGDRSLENE